MKKLQSIKRATATLLLVPMLMSSSGCALIFNQRNQTVRINTTPPGRTVYVKGSPVKDGQSVTIEKEFNITEANIGSKDRPIVKDLKYNPDLWLVGDAALLFFFVIPGLIALGVDFGAGTWRTYEDPQILVVSEATVPVEPAPQPAPEPEPPKKPAPKPPAKTSPKPSPKKPGPTPPPEPSPIQP